MALGHEALFVNFAGKQISTQGISRVVAETATAAEVAQGQNGKTGHGKTETGKTGTEKRGRRKTNGEKREKRKNGEKRGKTGTGYPFTLLLRTDPSRQRQWFAATFGRQQRTV